MGQYHIRTLWIAPFHFFSGQTPTVPQRLNSNVIFLTLPEQLPTLAWTECPPQLPGHLGILSEPRHTLCFHVCELLGGRACLSPVPCAEQPQSRAQEMALW